MMMVVDLKKWPLSGGSSFLILSFMLLSGVPLLEKPLVETAAEAAYAAPTNDPVILSQVVYNVTKPFKMQMDEVKEVPVVLYFHKNVLSAIKKANIIRINFKTATLSPQFNVVTLGNASKQVTIFRKHLEELDYTQELRLKLRASYIGHAVLHPESISFNEPITNLSMQILLPDTAVNNHALPITIVQDDGILNKVFFISVSFLVIISYINLGAQLDMDNVQKIIKKPKTVILGFLVTVIVMPSVSWIVGQLLLGNQLLYRAGSFIFACCPAATASTLWTVMLDSDKELSVGLQIASTIGALLTMPALLYSMDMALDLEGNQYQIKVPYSRLAQTLLGLLVALFIGWQFVGKNERAKKFSSKVFRPLTFFVLLFIVIFSSIIYWYIYLMFDWNITFASLLITVMTYLISGLFGYLINFDLSHAIAICLSSTYNNSGIAFAVLLVAFESPDTYIAFVPCLTQVCTTSLMLYIIYSCLSFVKFIQRKHHPREEVNELNRNNRNIELYRDKPSDKMDIDNEEKAEFMAMITTDEIPNEPKTIIDDQTKVQINSNEQA